jgi:endonuclease/exonuclease/phosphatase family metal-dependent hydrolase
MAASPPERTVRVATFNLENLGAGAPGGSHDDERGAAERARVLVPQLLRLRADVLCLQEVDGQRRPDDARRHLDALDALIEATPYAGFARTMTESRSRGGPRDKHNLVILSGLGLDESRQILHHLVRPPHYAPIARNAAGDGSGDAPGDRAGDAASIQPVEWDRPALYARIDFGGPRPLHVITVHLRAPRAAFIAGGKSDRRTWRTMSGWAEGFFVAAIKSAGQALEVRLWIDRLFDADPDALIVACGDFNADGHEFPVRTVRGDEEDAGNAALASRTLVPLERSLARSRRFSVVHHGRPRMLDHILVSRALLAWYRGIEVHNEALGDELLTPYAVRGTLQSFHAPLVAEFRVPVA